MTDNSKKFEYWVDYDNDGTLNWRNAKTLNRYQELCDRKRRADLSKYDMFAAFSNEQFKEGMKKIRPLRQGEKLCHFVSGIYGTRDGIDRYLKDLRAVNDLIRKECDPQEVYVYEFNNYESCISSDGDFSALREIIDLFGEDVARTIKRVNGYFEFEQVCDTK